MASKAFRIPSLFSNSDWKVVFKDGKANWEQLFKSWRADALMAGTPLDWNIRIDQPETPHPPSYAKTFEFTITRTLTHQERPGTPIYHRRTYSVWNDAFKKQLEFGIYAATINTGQWLQLRPSAADLGTGDFLEFPHAAGLAPSRFTANKPWYDESQSYFHELEPDDGKPSREPWYLLSRTQTRQPPTADAVYNPAWAFDALNLALRECRGTQWGASSFHGLVPTFVPVAFDFDPFWIMQLTDRSGDGSRAWSTQLLRIDLGPLAPGKRLDANIDWYSPYRDGDSAAATGFILRGSIDPDINTQQFQRPWGPDGLALFRTFEGMADASHKDGLITNFRLKNCQVLGDASWIRMGSIEIQPLPSTDCALTFRAGGNLGTGATAIFPYCDLQGLRCRVRNAAGTDTDREIAREDQTTEQIDELRRETTPIVGKLDDQSFRTGTLSATTIYQGGRDALTRMSIVVDSASDELKGSAVWLNLRPFIAALVDFPRSQDTTTTLRWNSDDKDGAQWRAENPLVSVVLPPQAVGEEMERGGRFYDVPDTPDISSTRPVPYRFSRGTYLTLRPSPAVERRRFEISPINLRTLMRGSHVQRMVVEMAYPLETVYERGRGITRDIMLTEAGEFFGSPSESLVRDRQSLALGHQLPENLKTYLISLPPADRDTYVDAVLDLIDSQHAAQMNYSARLAELHIHDPSRPRNDLQLTGPELRTYLRDTDIGAKPLLDPLPSDSLWLPSQVSAAFAKFLHQGTSWGTPQLGGLRGGLIHSLEMPSELQEVLDHPTAVSQVIDALTLSALGASGRAEAAFANGKTSFAIVAEHGQLAKLIKTRVGRIGALWNRTKHVIVYERTAARSAQFQDEQTHTQNFDKWPILRKTEEYLEPIQAERDYGKEEQKDANATRFIRASVFATRRIYVNSAWARDLGDGYELPLWDRVSAEANQKFYPKPKLFLDCFGEENRSVRLWFTDPDCLYFYTSTAPGTDADVDRWDPKSGVDFDNRPRLPILEEVPASSQRMAPRTPANADLCLSPRFDLAVEAEGKINIQYGHGDSPMLVALSRVQVSRSSQGMPVKLADLPEVQPAIVGIRTSADAQRSASQLAPSLSRLSTDLTDCLESAIYKYKDDPTVNPCDRAAADLKKLVANAITDFRALLNPTARLDLDRQISRTPAMWLTACGVLDGWLRSRAFAADQTLAARVDALLAELDDLHDAIPDTATDLSAQLFARKTAFVAQFQGFWDDIERRVKDGLAAPAKKISEAIAEAVREAVRASGILADTAVDFEHRCNTARQAVAEAGASLAKLPRESRDLLDPLGLWLRLISDQLTVIVDAAQYLRQVAPGLADGVTTEAATLARAVGDFAGVLALWATGQLKPVADAITDQIDMLDIEVATQLDPVSSKLHGDEVRVALTALRKFTRESRDGLLAGHRRAVSDLEKGLEAARTAVASALSDQVKKPMTAIAQACERVAAKIEEMAHIVQLKLEQTIDSGHVQCNQLVTNIQREIAQAEQWARQQADAVLTDLLANEAAQQMSHCVDTAGKVWDIGSRAVSLARAVGDLPKITPLRFDIDAAAYVFDGKKPEIKMSPAIAKLQREGEALLESLGLTVPCSELRDRLIPDLDLSNDFDFNDVFNKFAGMDLQGLFRKFKLPSLNSDNVQITHGFDPTTRRAWVNSSVGFSHPAYEELFAFGPVELGLERMRFDAFSGVQTVVVGNTPQPPESKTHASLTADWVLQGAGQRLVTFKKVAIKFDGASGFDFDVSPDNIELHPSLKFISEFVEQFKGKLPPAVQIEEENGRPVGVNAGTTIVLDDLPDLGAVTIGPIDMRSSLGLRLEEGRFVIASSFSLGSKQKPIFVQITWLGGGCWLEAKAKYVDGEVIPSMSVGLSVGATRAFNLAGVAKGSFSVQLYCYIEIQKSYDSVAIGLSITGSALVVGFVNANLNLLLEAKHSKGTTEGTGRLDVEVKISWFFTFRFKQTVNHKF